MNEPSHGLTVTWNTWIRPPAQLTVIVPVCVWLRATSADAVVATANDATAAIASARNKRFMISPWFSAGSLRPSYKDHGTPTGVAPFGTRVSIFWTAEGRANDSIA